MLRGSELLRLTTWTVLLVAMGLMILRLRAPDAGPRPAQDRRADETLGSSSGAGKQAGPAAYGKLHRTE